MKWLLILLLALSFAILFKQHRQIAELKDALARAEEAASAEPTEAPRRFTPSRTLLDQKEEPAPATSPQSSGSRSSNWMWDKKESLSSLDDGPRKDQSKR
jgi:hypothetical protein